MKIWDDGGNKGGCEMVGWGAWNWDLLVGRGGNWGDNEGDEYHELNARASS